MRQYSENNPSRVQAVEGLCSCILHVDCNINSRSDTDKLTLVVTELPDEKTNELVQASQTPFRNHPLRRMALPPIQYERFKYHQAGEGKRKWE